MTAVETLRSTLDDTDLAILSRRAGLFWAHHAGPSVGDYVDYADGVSRRIGHVWHLDKGVHIQTSDSGSFYLSHDVTCAFSGGLYPGIAAETLTWTDEKREGAVWFFHHDQAHAHNGVYTSMPFTVYRCSQPALTANA